MTVSVYAVWFLWVALAYELVGIVIHAILARQGTKTESGRNFTEAHVWVGYLHHFGVDGGYLQFSKPGTGCRVRFQKYGRKSGKSGIALDMPVPGWSGNDLAKLRAYCDQNCLELSDTDETGDDRNIRIDCSDAKIPVDTLMDRLGAGAVERADGLALEIWTKVFRLSPDFSYIVEYNGINVEYPRIGIASWPLLMTRIVLPVVVLFSLGMPPDWTIPLRDATAGGSMAGLAFFIMYFAALAIGGLGKTSPYHIRRVSRRFYRAGYHLIGLLLPIAVVLIWAGA